MQVLFSSPSALSAKNGEQTLGCTTCNVEGGLPASAYRYADVHPRVSAASLALGMRPNSAVISGIPSDTLPNKCAF